MADTVDETARYLEALEARTVEVGRMPLLGVEGPRPEGSRLVFDRDSIARADGESLADLLSRVPGVHLWRGGWIGRPAFAGFQGRGAASVEYLVDGLPYLAIGPDSTAVDPSLVALELLERVEVERWPGLLRVHLFTRRHDRLAARSHIGLATGSEDLTSYSGSLERRFAGGLGFGVAADYLNLNEPTGLAGTYRNTQLWVQGGWIPSPRLGVQYQLLRSQPRREARIPPGAADSLDRGLEGTRTDAQLRGFWRARDDGFGPGVDVLLGRVRWSGDPLEQTVHHAGLALTLREPTWSVQATGAWRSRWTALDSRIQAGWTPSAAVIVSGEAGWQRHRGGRISRWVGARVGVGLPAGLNLSASALTGSRVALPAVLTDSAQDVTDLGLGLSWDRRWIGGRIEWNRTSAFRPTAFPAFRTVVALPAVPETEWFVTGGHLRPVNWLELDGWYSHPLSDIPMGQPPEHFFGRATVRSKFLRVFPSGVFELALQGSMERWGEGFAGLDPAGTPVPLPAATFLHSNVQLVLGGFTAFWERGNLGAVTTGYVPGLPLLAYGDRFGVRWEFWN